MLRVYTASKLSSASLWLQIHAEWPEAYCHARWLKHTQLGTPDTPEHAARFWVEDEMDVRHADVVLVYGREGEHLRGALVEAGIGIALGKTVIVIGRHPDYGTWQYHPGVRRAADLAEVRSILRTMLAEPRP